MNTETTGAEAPAADVAAPEAQAPAPVETSEATTETQPDAESQDGDDAAEERPRKKPGIHNRIDELTRQKHDALREAEHWRTRYEEAQKTDISELDYEDQIAEKVRRANRQEQAETASQKAQSLSMEMFRERETAVMEEYRDYADVAYKGWDPTPAMLAVIIESEVGPKLAYHLGKNKSDYARIAALPDIQQARELGKLEAAITAPKTGPKIPAAPIKPVSGIATGGAKDPSAMSMSEYVAWRKSQDD